MTGNKNKRIGLVVTASQKEKLLQIADKENRSLSNLLVSSALSRYNSEVKQE